MHFFTVEEKAIMINIIVWVPTFKLPIPIWWIKACGNRFKDELKVNI